MDDTVSSHQYVHRVGHANGDERFICACARKNKWNRNVVSFSTFLHACTITISRAYWHPTTENRFMSCMQQVARKEWMGGGVCHRVIECHALPYAQAVVHSQLLGARQSRSCTHLSQHSHHLREDGLTQSDFLPACYLGWYALRALPLSIHSFGDSQYKRGVVCG